MRAENDVSPSETQAAGVVVRRVAAYCDAAVAALALLVALAARLLHLDAGPYGRDEHYVVLHALKFGTGDLNPRHFDWPASPLYYMTFFIDGLYFVCGYLFGLFRSPTSFVVDYLSYPRTIISSREPYPQPSGSVRRPS